MIIKKCLVASSFAYGFLAIEVWIVVIVWQIWLDVISKIKGIRSLRRANILFVVIYLIYTGI